MKPVKRTSSTSPRSRRPAKFSDTSDICEVSSIDCGRYAVESGREAPPSAATGNASFDPYLPRIASRVDPSSSPYVYSQQHDNRTHFSSCLSPTEHLRLSLANASAKNMNGVRKAKTPISSPQNLAQCDTGFEQSSFWSGTVPDGQAEKTQPLFDAVAGNMLFPGSTADFDLRGHGTPGQGLPVTAAFEYGLNGDFGFDSLYGSLASLDFSASMPNDLSSTTPELNAMMLDQDSDEFSTGTGANFGSTLSPVSEYSIKKSQDALKGIGSHSDTGTTCMISALKILRALHLPRPECLHSSDETATSSPRQPRMIDSVLSMNRKIVLLVSDMIKCPCSSNSQLQLVLTVINSKLMAWCRAMIRNDDDSSDDCSSMGQSTVNNNMNDEDQAERVSHRPITVGEYSFDVTLERKIWAQVVSSELQQVERLVESLSRRMQETNFGKVDIDAATRVESRFAAESGRPTMDETGQAKAIHGALSAFLHKQLRAAKAEVSS